MECLDCHTKFDNLEAADAHSIGLRHEVVVAQDETHDCELSYGQMQCDECGKAAA